MDFSFIAVIFLYALIRISYKLPSETEFSPSLEVHLLDFGLHVDGNARMEFFAEWSTCAWCAY